MEIDIEQDTTQWHEWRKGGIGSSDIPSIMGINPYKSAYQLFLETTGKKQREEVTEAMTHGKEMEPIARNLFNETFGMNFSPQCFQHDQLSFLRASLDGHDDEQKAILEIKSPFSARKIESLWTADSPPIVYSYQIQYQMLVSGLSTAYLAIYDSKALETQLKVFRIKEDIELQKKILEEVTHFWKSVQTNTPPEMDIQEHMVIEDTMLLEKLQEYEKYNSLKKEYTEKEKELKQQVLDMGDGANFQCGKYKITYCSPRKSYDTKQMKDDGIDIEKYAVVSDKGAIRITFSK